MPPAQKIRIVFVTNQDGTYDLLRKRLGASAEMVASVKPLWFGEAPSGNQLAELDTQINRAFGQTPQFERTVAILCQGQRCHTGVTQLRDKLSTRGFRTLLFLQNNNSIVFNGCVLNGLVLCLIQAGINTRTGLEERFGDLGILTGAWNTVAQLINTHQVRRDIHQQTDGPEIELLVTVDPAARK